MTLRYWPWLVLCIFGALVFAPLGLFAAGIAVSRIPVAGRVVAWLFVAGLVGLVVYFLASLRTRTMLDRDGVTRVSAFGRRRTEWSTVDQLDVVHALEGWGVRAWSGNDRTIIYLCHDTHGRRPKASTHEHPPGEAPRALHEGFELIDRYVRSHRR